MPGSPAIANRSTLPAGRVGLICGANALLSAASVATGPPIKAMLITATVAAFVLMMRWAGNSIERREFGVDPL
jgi:hypothetical protein